MLVTSAENAVSTPQIALLGHLENQVVHPMPEQVFHVISSWMLDLLDYIFLEHTILFSIILDNLAFILTELSSMYHSQFLVLIILH